MTRVLIWDVDGAPPAGDGLVVLWRAFTRGADAGVISVSALIEVNAESLRARYLTWVYELGETLIKGKRLLDHLEIRPGFSYWWMTLLAEKCNYSKSPQINDAIKLLAFEQWADQCRPSQVKLITANAALQECMGSLCRNSGISFLWQPGPSVKHELPWAKRLYRALPWHLQSFVWLVAYALRRWPLRGVGLAEWRQSNRKVTFFSYLLNLVPEAAKCGRFESRYWGHLPEELRKDGTKTNWLHLYMESDALPSAATAAGALRQFNYAGRGEQIHVTLDSFLSLKLVFQAALDALWLWRLGRTLRPSSVVSDLTRIDLWPLYRAEWARSLSGAAVMSNVLNLNLLEFAVRCLPMQKAGVYLQENQAWEFALVHAWKTAGHRCLIGFPHSTVRYWDLRYFFSTQNYRDGERNGLPRPDQIAVNGVVARDALIAGGYPERELVMVESLRYFHLLRVPGAAPRVGRQVGVPLRVLVMADIVERNNERQMRLLEGAVRFLPADTVYTVKPHPACALAPDDYPGIRMTLSIEPIAELLADCDVVYTGNLTSAAVDAYFAGVPVVSMLDPAILNLSPLRERTGTVFVSTPSELAEALVARASQPSSYSKPEAFFTLEQALPRWRKLLQA